MALKSSREGLRKELVDYLGNLIVDDNLGNEIIKAVGDKFVTPEVLNENVNNLTMQITTESGERIEADDTLQSNITAEATAREQADTTLQNNITAEATAREQADTTLQNNINAETTARQEDIHNLENLIGTSGLQMDLLWTNASPTSAFASQTISLDLNNYKSVLILTKEHPVVNNISTHLIPINNKAYILHSDSNTFQYRRIETITTSYISFTSGYICNGYGNATEDDNRAYPIEIYGIK